jgi:hypothetical protein
MGEPKQDEGQLDKPGLLGDLNFGNRELSSQLCAYAGFIRRSNVAPRSFLACYGDGIF